MARQRKDDGPDPLIGCVVGERYRIVSVVGRGGMGVVYRGEDERLHGRPAAIKILLRAFTRDPQNLQRFEREVRIISMLRSPHVVHVFDTGRLDDGRPFIVMELLEGRTLSAVQKKGQLSIARALRITDGVLAALSEAHENGIIHRDLKPTNVFLVKSRTGGEIPKVLDFGIAKDLSDRGDADITSHDTAVGTPKYMAPEQFTGAQATTRADLYAVGVLLYQMLAGRAPFLATDPVPPEVAELPRDMILGWLHLHAQPTPLPALSPALWALLGRLLAKQPEARFQSADEVTAALRTTPEAQGILSDGSPNITGEATAFPGDGSSSSGFPVLGETGAQRPSGARRGALPIAAIALSAAVIALVWFNRQRTIEPHPAAPMAAVVAGDEPTPHCLDIIKTVPPKATVMRGARPLGLTPLFLRERPCEERWALQIELSGYQTAHWIAEGRMADEPPPLRLEPVAKIPDAGVERPTTPPPISRRRRRRHRAAPETDGRPARRAIKPRRRAKDPTKPTGSASPLPF